MSGTRRQFIQAATVGVMSTCIATRRSASAAAMDTLRVGVVGVGSQGKHHLRHFLGLDGVDVAYVCDVDESQLAAAAAQAPEAQAVSDLRRILDDKSIDAISIATPDHWHAPAAILACQAGKHVYVEKPCCHNFREGQMLVAAARKYQRVVQHGTQSRSNPMIANAVQMLREGIIGDILVAKAWNIQRRDDIGRTVSSDPPSGFDYDQWVGPAEMVPFRTNCHHYTWRWWYNFGSGDLGNDGVHELDYARWGLGVEGLPSRVTGIGGKYFFADDQQFPDTQTIIFEYAGTKSHPRNRQLIFEMRLWSTNYPYNTDSGAEFWGTDGKLFVSKRGKLEVVLGRNESMKDPRPKEPVALTTTNHYQDFVDSIRQEKTPQAEIEVGFHSAALATLGNVSTRLGRSVRLDDQSQNIEHDDEANELLGRKYRREGHWAVPRLT